MLCKMSQGVTTVVVGNCGISLSPVRMTSRPVPPLDLLGDESWWTFDSFGEYAERLARDPPPVNTYALIGHMSLRVEAMGGDTQRAATDKEAAHMQRRLAEALAQGASGFSTGLYYPPNMMAPTDEVIAVAEALRGAGGIYVTHMRDEADDVLLSIEETLKIGRAVNVPVVISHHKCAMPENYGRSVETLPRIDAAAPRQQRRFRRLSLCRRLDRADAANGCAPTCRCRSPGRCRIPNSPAGCWTTSRRNGASTPREAAERLLPAGAIFFQMDEQDVQRIMAHRLAMIGSDGLPHDAYPASAPVGDLPARARPLRARSRPVQHGSGGAQDDRPHRRGVRPGGSRRDPRRRLRRPRAVRSGDRARRLDVRGADQDRRRGFWKPGSTASRHTSHGKGAVAAHAGRLVTRNR